MKQTASDRIKRLNEGRCPIHGGWMGQIDGWHEPQGGEPYTIVGCSRRACKISVISYGFDGPWKLPPEFESLLNDSQPDPEYIDPNILPANSKKPLKKYRSLVWNKSNGYCYYCGELISPESMTIDHVVPECYGGTDSIENLVPVCKSCNSSKGSKTIEAFRVALTEREFLKVHGVYFSDAQRFYLESQHGIRIEVKPFTFWFEEGKPNN